MLSSRIHAIRYISKSGCHIFIKRDDELGFGISGTKQRKYTSLLQKLKEKQISHTVLIGGAYSNNIVGLTQLLLENGIIPYLFLRGEKERVCQGNFLLISLLVSQENITWVSRQEWKNVHQQAADFLCTLTGHGLIIPEGASMSEALEGALTLGRDIYENEQSQKIKFNHIFIEAGTGLAAIGLILGLKQLHRNPHIHVLLLAMKEIEFWQQLAYFYNQLNMNFKWADIKKKVHCHYPLKAKSFGATNQTIFKTIIDIARQDGILTDPIYTAKLFLFAKNLIENQNHIVGNILLIHGGGGLGLMGYQQQLCKLLSKS